MPGDTNDRGGQDVGNIVALEHVNVRVPDQQIATIFYVMGLGLTRDPYLMVGIDNMWINVGQQQFHLPTGAPQVVRGSVGLVLPDLDALTARLAGVKGRLAGTKFAYTVEDTRVLVTCPWGNRLRCHPPGPGFGDMTLGMPYVEFSAPPGHAAGIANFYEAVLEAASTVTQDGGSSMARARVGARQELIFRETPDAIPPYDGHHIQIYVADFSTAHRHLKQYGLITEESSEHQYRFQEIVDFTTQRPLFTLEHEVRSLLHPLYQRPLVNRNPAQRQATYQRGRDHFVPGMA
ncbi:MAG: hypothetical protein HY724_07250 [Candidatus Rokubacteria bacterium]|nr:hypothetical protein [Candidatus Rokubacteria bacterium]